MNWFNVKNNYEGGKMSIQLEHLFEVNRGFVKQIGDILERLSIIEKELKELKNAKQMV